MLNSAEIWTHAKEDFLRDIVYIEQLKSIVIEYIFSISNQNMVST